MQNGVSWDRDTPFFYGAGGQLALLFHGRPPSVMATR
jgi:hypothetical protein